MSLKEVQDAPRGSAAQTREYQEHRVKKNCVIQRVETMHPHILHKLGEVMGPQRQPGKEWALCGPASVVYSRLIHARFGIPISREGRGPRLELAIGLYDPKDTSKKKIDHTYIRYYPGETDRHGQEVVWSIDPIYDAFFNNKGEKGKIAVKKHTVGSIDRILEEKSELVLPERDPNYFLTVDFFGNTQPDPYQLEDVLDAFHTDNVTKRTYVGKYSGRVRDVGMWGENIASVIKSFHPGWKGMTNVEHAKPVVLFNALQHRERTDK